MLKKKPASKKHIIITEKPDLITLNGEDNYVITPDAFITNSAKIDLRQGKRIRVINLCKSYEYLSRGYYCSLLAEARGQQCLPPIDSVVTLNWKRLSRNAKPELDALIAKHYREPLSSEIAKTFLFYFGRSEDSRLEFLSRRVFDIFRFPIVSVEIKYDENRWNLSDVMPVSFSRLPKSKLAFFNEALASYTGKAWNSKKKKAQEKFWLAVLHNPGENMPPSNKGALNALARAAKRQNVFFELITKNDMSTLLEFDALFIRETTAIDHHTYRFSHKAEMEGMPCIDDTASIIRCSNKVFLHELLSSHNIRVPKTEFLDHQKASKIEKSLVYPIVLKVPDGSFSRGIAKVDNVDEFKRSFFDLSRKSDLVLLQEYLPSDFDWRIGVLDGEPLFACRYFMAKGHWQIYNHSASGSKKSGDHETVRLHDVPKDVLRTACKAASLVGSGLYGVDLKENKNGVYVVEVNDNPNIDKGVEDSVAGDSLYDRIIEHFGTLVEKA